MEYQAVSKESGRDYISPKKAYDLVCVLYCQNHLSEAFTGFFSELSMLCKQGYWLALWLQNKLGSHTLFDLRDFLPLHEKQYFA